MRTSKNPNKSLEVYHYIIRREKGYCQVKKNIFIDKKKFKKGIKKKHCSGLLCFRRRNHNRKINNLNAERYREPAGSKPSARIKFLK